MPIPFSQGEDQCEVWRNKIDISVGNCDSTLDRRSCCWMVMDINVPE